MFRINGAARTGTGGSTHFKLLRAVLTGLAALILLATGLGLLLVKAAPTAAEWARMRDWEAAPARLVAVGLASSETALGLQQWEAKVRYEYRWEGQRRIGTRVSLHQGPEVLGHFQPRTAERLQRTYNLGAPLKVWVDPRHPEQSVFDRTLRMDQFSLLLAGGLLLTLCGAVGALSAAAGVRAVLRPAPAAPGRRAQIAELRTVCDFKTVPDGMRMTFPAGRHGVHAATLLVAAVCLMGVVAGILSANGSRALAALIAVAGLTAASVGLWVVGLRQESTIDSRKGLHVRRQFFGLMLREQRMPFKQIHQLRIQQGMITVDLDGLRTHYRLFARSISDEWIAISASLPSQRAADVLREEIAWRAGLPID